jgi:hypothetical protein
MAFDAGDIRVAGVANIYLAPLATPFPAWDTAPATPWMDLGYVTPDGITANYGREVTEIYAMQSADPVRIISTRMPKTIGFSMMQQGRDQLILAMGGGTYALEASETDVFRYTPPEASVIDERAMLVEMVDGLYTYRWEYQRVMNREGVEEKLLREDSVNFPVTMAILIPADNSAPFNMITNDPAYAPPLPFAADADANGTPNGEPAVESGETTAPDAYEAEPTDESRLSKRGR